MKNQEELQQAIHETMQIQNEIQRLQQQQKGKQVQYGILPSNHQKLQVALMQAQTALQQAQQALQQIEQAAQKLQSTDSQ